MAKWRIKTDSYGNDQASFYEVIDGINVAAFLHDCDGEGVAWSVYHNGDLCINGEVLVNGTTMQAEKDAWEEAKLRAQAYICNIPGYPMLFSMPKWLFNKVYAEHLLNSCDVIIRDFEEKYPDHPLVAAFGGK